MTLMKNNIYENKHTSVLLCLLACLLWGSLFPIIKMGYSSFEISSSDVPSIVLFAGLRFLISGIVLIVLSSIKQKRFDIPQKSNIKYIILGALFTIILHYSLTYIALSLGEGSKSAIIKQIGFLFLSCFAFVFDKKDKWSVKKTIAGIIGFCGIISTNSEEAGFILKAVDIILIASSFCSIYGSVVAKKSSKYLSSSQFVAYSQFLGGMILCVAGIGFGGRITHIDVMAVLVFGYICLASISAYLIWNLLLKYNNLSRLAIIKFTEPLFAVILSGVILKENIFKLSYLIALILILLAILVENLNLKRKI